MCVYLFMHIITINEKENMNLKESEVGIYGGVGGRKWKVK